MTDDQKTESPVLSAMLEYSQAVRGDWSNFDGSSLKLVIEDWVDELRQPDPSHDIEWHRRDLGICMAGGGHWCGRWGYCDDECGCVPCAEERRYSPKPPYKRLLTRGTGSGRREGKPLTSLVAARRTAIESGDTFWLDNETTKRAYETLKSENTRGER